MGINKNVRVYAGFLFERNSWKGWKVKVARRNLMTRDISNSTGPKLSTRIFSNLGMIAR